MQNKGKITAQPFYEGRVTFGEACPRPDSIDAPHFPGAFPTSDLVALFLFLFSLLLNLFSKIKVSISSSFGLALCIAIFLSWRLSIDGKELCTAMNTTIKYYNDNARKFCADTLSVSMAEHYARFEDHLRPGARILDAGCGSGRDASYFKGKGYQVEAFDASEEMVQYSSAWTGVAVRQATFLDFQASGRFDAIWACASLLHIGRPEITLALQRLVDSLQIGGVMYMSFKYGNEEYAKEGRLFNCYDEASFTDLIAKFSSLSILELYKSADARIDRSGEFWLNALVKKQN